MSHEFRTCRVCKQDDLDDKLVKYSVRHYAHPDCALKMWGAAFFDRLTPWQCSNFPVLIAYKHGVLAQCEARIAQMTP